MSLAIVEGVEKESTSDKRPNRSWRRRETEKKSLWSSWWWWKEQLKGCNSELN